MHIDRAVTRPPRCGLVFFVDGLSPTVLHALARDGRLPNIEARFVRGGCEVAQVSTCLPSVTYANTPTLITGCFPARHGLFGSRWLDPVSFEGRDYTHFWSYRNAGRDLLAPTLYERLSGETTLNVQCHTRRGQTHTIDQDVSSGILWGLSQFEWVDRRVGGVLPRVARWINKVGRWPILWMNYFPGVDEIGHRFGPDSEEYSHAICNVDRQIGRIADAAEQALGRDTGLHCTLVTDHGMATIRNGFPLAELVRRATGLRVATHVRAFSDPRRQAQWLSEHDAILFIESDRCARFHVRPERGWAFSKAVEACEPGGKAGADHQPDAAITERLGELLRQMTGVSYVSLRRGERAVLQAGRSRLQSVVHLPAESTYEFAPPAAPARAPANGGIGPSRWPDPIAMPDLPVQIAALHGGHRAGDIIAFADSQAAFSTKHRGGHGSCLLEDASVSHFYAGPSLLAGSKISGTQIADFAPTQLELLTGKNVIAPNTWIGSSLARRILAGNPELSRP